MDDGRTFIDNPEDFSFISLGERWYFIVTVRGKAFISPLLDMTPIWERQFKDYDAGKSFSAIVQSDLGKFLREIDFESLVMESLL